MYNTSNPTVREFRLIVLWKLLNDYVSVKEHPLVVKNYLNPQYRDLINGIKEILPHTKKDQYTLYCRYKGDEIFQINNYLSMITAFRIMEAHDSLLLYLIRKDIGEWPAPRKDLMDEPGDAEIIFESCPDERVFTDLHRGRGEHKIFQDDDESRVKKDRNQQSIQHQLKDNTQSAARPSTRRKSNRRQSNRKTSNRRQSAKRQSKK